MKAPVEKLLPFLQKESFLARQDRAAVELKTDVIRIMILEAARKGLTGIRIRMPDSLDVKGTPAAADLKTWCRKEGLTLTWERRSATLEGGRQSDVWEPDISWAPKVADS
ncbi:hypothetical protein GWG65_02870 [Bradyrhizobium sp. CSA207]|uniref:hypothetical protein n=1 Tax=Bradyrhizobium sp. CSA207 TaxID=2698826 RepID=UPI0023AEA83E|nr:hypothetical protein [Bradyrhizobium sp. CSA207]MDE5440405.1 hypothetical protein [Bradyrhizobium sp. CSA207]